MSAAGQSHFNLWLFGPALPATVLPAKVGIQCLKAVGMAGTDFETAAREQFSIITVIVNNGARYVTGKYAAVAQSLGAHAEHVTDPN